MSDDTSHLIEALNASQKRFEVYVPNPAVRLNMGAPAVPPGSEDVPFGYAGATLAAADDVFVSADNMLVHQGRGGVFTSTHPAAGTPR